MSILLTAVMSDGQRWGLFPAQFTEDELKTYRHIFEHFGISELEPGTAVKFHSHYTKERVIALLDAALEKYQSIASPVEN